MRTIITALLICFCSAVYSQTVVVVPTDSMVKSLSDLDVANIFLARTNRYPNGEKSIPIELKNDILREMFYQNISGKTPKQLTAYWTTLVFTGKGRPPKGYMTNNELMHKFEMDSGAITYLDETQVTNNMRVVYSFP